MITLSRRPPLFRPEGLNRSFTATRAVDVALAAGGLIVLAPLLVLVAVAVWLDMRSSVIFVQLRVGMHGQHFRLYKFRKFDEKSPARGGGPLTLNNDPRMTRLGRMLAQTKLDELPQLWNVLKGDMAIVGPRPESIDFAGCLDGWSLHHRPGIFGPAQVFFRNEAVLFQNREGRDLERFYREVVYPLKARIDDAYYPNRSLAQDIIWVFRGILAVFGWTMPLQGPSDLPGEVENWILCNLTSGQGDRKEPAGGIQSEGVGRAPFQSNCD